MPNATKKGGDLVNLPNCFIQIPVPRPVNVSSGSDCTVGNNTPGLICLNALPDISDNKSASYNDEAIMGRSTPLKTYSHSETRTISMQLHFYTIKQGDSQKNLTYLKLLESIVYPRTDNTGTLPFIPPYVCTIQCGSLLSSDSNGNPLPICAVLKSYSIRFPTDVAWDSQTYLPYKFDVDTNWDVVYSTDSNSVNNLGTPQSGLPGQERIMQFGA